MHARLRPVAFWSLIVLSVFQALSAVVGGVGILATGGLGMPASFLAGGPFTSFVWPGVILLIVAEKKQAGFAAWASPHVTDVDNNLVVRAY